MVHPAMSGRVMSSVMAPGLNSRARDMALLPRSATSAFDAAVVRQVHQNAGEGDVVLDDQQHGIARLDQVAVVVDLQISCTSSSVREGRRRQNHVHARASGSCRASADRQRRIGVIVSASLLAAGAGAT